MFNNNGGMAVEAIAVDISVADYVDSLGRAFAVYVGAAGDVKVLTQAGNTVIFVAPLVGAVLPVAVTKVIKVGTTATSMLAVR